MEAKIKTINKITKKIILQSQIVRFVKEFLDRPDLYEILGFVILNNGKQQFKYILINDLKGYRLFLVNRPTHFLDQNRYRVKGQIITETAEEVELLKNLDKVADEIGQIYY